MAFLQHQTGQIFYDIYGQTGPYLTCINGHTRSSLDFRLLAKNLNKQGYRALLIDNRGSGKTTSEPNFTLSQIAEDIIAVWEKLGIQKSHLLGISMGGLISQIVCLLKPEKILSLSLVSSFSSLNEVSFKNEDWPNDQEGIQEKLRLYFSENYYSKNKILIEAMVKNIHKEVQNGAFNKGAKAQRVAMANSKNLNIISEKINCPTLILHGKDDQIVPVEQAEILGRKIPNSEVKIFEQMGHLLLAEMGKKLQENLVLFLNEQPTAKADTSTSQ